MLYAATTANAVAHEIGHRHVGLSAGVRISDGRLVDDLWNGFVRESRSADVDERPETRHCRACRDAAEADLGDGRGFHTARELLTQTGKLRLARPGSNQTATDQYDAAVLFQDFAEGAPERFTE